MRITRKMMLQRLSQMNWHYGRGDVVSIDIVEKIYSNLYAGGVFSKGIAVRRLQHSADSKRFTCDGKTIHFLGHQSDLTKTMII